MNVHGLLAPRAILRHTLRNATLVIVAFTAALACSNASADSYSAQFRYYMEYGSGCPILFGTVFTSGIDAAETCVRASHTGGGPGDVCDWYFWHTMSHEWPEPNNQTTLRVYTTPCDAGTNVPAGDISRVLSCPWGGGAERHAMR